ncbi:MAG: sulfatase [Akkermansiaceae bacterium]
MFHRLLLLLCPALLAAAPNVLLICVDDLRPELRCFGKDYIHSPHIDSLARNGRAFTRHYVQAPTCGASRYTLLTGRYGPASNGALFARAKDIQHPSLPAYFRARGYNTVSVGKVSHHPGGRGGKDWNDGTTLEMPNSWDRHLLPAGAWQHPRGWMHGLAHGEIRKNAKDMDLIQALEGGDEIYPDGLSIEETLKQLKLLAADKKPFFLATGILRPHLPFGAPKKYLDLYQNVQLPQIPHPTKPEGKTTWHGSGEFMKYNRNGKDPNTDAGYATAVRKHYAACVSYADAQVGRVLGQLDALRLRDNTIIVLWGDHGWHLGEHAIWGKHSLFEESLRSPLIISAPGMGRRGESSGAVVQTLDLFPTLCDLAKFPKPDFLHGSSLTPQLKYPHEPSKNLAISYRKNVRTIRTGTHRLIAHEDGTHELYRMRSSSDSEKIEDPEITQKLKALLDREY